MLNMSVSATTISCDPRALARDAETSLNLRRTGTFEVFLTKTHTCFCTPIQNGTKRLFEFEGFKIREALILAAHCENCYTQRSYNKDASCIFSADPSILISEAMSWYKTFVLTDGDLQKYTADMTGGKLASFSLGCDKNSVAVTLTVTEEDIDFPERWEVKKNEAFEDAYNSVLDTALKFYGKLYPHSSLTANNEEVIRTYMLHVLF